MVKRLLRIPSLPPKILVHLLLWTCDIEKRTLLPRIRRLTAAKRRIIDEGLERIMKKVKKQKIIKGRLTNRKMTRKRKIMMTWNMLPDFRKRHRLTSQEKGRGGRVGILINHT